eukprot:CAMPEP_0194482040 /NCGR_PEP_ID=MMETSP0253-20130528/4178_1 /TAXON_ID=2966 /ORGANISM="Noctiluca scintillans" /LENGTH=160 /DNA_ID=CAMNT_0039321553 /DNA_START=128 /DNA_END=610 /DNA_ORIENTATION=+
MSEPVFAEKTLLANEPINAWPTNLSAGSSLAVEPTTPEYVTSTGGQLAIDPEGEFSRHGVSEVSRTSAYPTEDVSLYSRGVGAIKQVMSLLVPSSTIGRSSFIHSNASGFLGFRIGNLYKEDSSSNWASDQHIVLAQSSLTVVVQLQDHASLKHVKGSLI